MRREPCSLRMNNSGTVGIGLGSRTTNSTLHRTPVPGSQKQNSCVYPASPCLVSVAFSAAQAVGSRFHNAARFRFQIRFWRCNRTQSPC